MYIRNKKVLVPVLHDKRSIADRVFVAIWTLMGGSFEHARVGVDCATWMTPKYFAKKRVRVRANT